MHVPHRPRLPISSRLATGCRPAGLLVIAGLTLIASLSVSYGQETRERLLIDDEPFDVIILKEDMQSFRVMPLKIAPRKPLAAIKPDAVFEVKLIDRPDKRYRIRGEAIARIRLFEELVLEEATQYVERQAFEAAYRAYRFLKQTAPDFPGLDQGWQNALMTEAKQWIGKSEWSRAWRVLLELHERNAKFDELSAVMGTVAQQLVAAALKDDQVRRARSYADQLKQLYPKHGELAELSKRLGDYAAKQLELASTAPSPTLGAITALRRAVLAAPDRTDAADRLRKAQETATWFGVVVRDRIPKRDSLGPWSWSSQRVEWLTAPPLARPGAESPTAPVFAAPLGTWSIADGAATFKWQAGSARPDLGAVKRRLELYFRLSPLQSVFDWRLHDAAERTIRIESKRSHPTTWLGLVDIAAPEGGRYTLSEQGGQRRLEPSQAGLPHLIEQHVAEIETALNQIETLERTVIDRVWPWEVHRLSHSAALTIEPYGATSMLWVVFNPKSPRVADPLVRWALARSIDRAHIVEDLCDGDPSGIAWPLDTFAPRRWTPKHGTIPYEPETLVAALGAGRSRDPRSDGRRAKIVLAHGRDPLATRTAEALQDQWQLAGLGPTVTLRPTDTFPPDDAWDAYVVTWYRFDPRWDTWRLLGPGGLSGPPSLRLRRVLQTGVVAREPDPSKWIAAVAETTEAEATVIPLWEVQEFFGRAPEMNGLGKNPTVLYENVMTWKYEPK